MKRLVGFHKQCLGLHVLRSRLVF